MNVVRIPATRVTFHRGQLAVELVERVHPRREARERPGHRRGWYHARVTLSLVKIAFFLNRDVHALEAMHHLKDVLERHEAAIFLSGGVGKPPAVEELDQLRLVEQELPFRLDPDAFERLGAPCAMENAPNAPEALARLTELAPDVVVSIRYGRIFKGDFLGIPKLGVLNLHSGVLPDYRGVLATFRALLDDAPEIGATLHFITDPTIDTGPIVGIARRPVAKERSLFAHVLGLYEPGAELVRKALALLDAGQGLDATAQRPDEGRYFTYPTAEEVAAFLAKGYRLFRASDVRELLAR
jgi:methionyl-tRNA formyltransferase